MVLHNLGTSSKTEQAFQNSFKIPLIILLAIYSSEVYNRK